MFILLSIYSIIIQIDLRNKDALMRLLKLQGGSTAHITQREHEIIFQAIQRGEPGFARQCVRNHVENTESWLRSSNHYSSAPLRGMS